MAKPDAGVITSWASSAGDLAGDRSVATAPKVQTDESLVIVKLRAKPNSHLVAECSSDPWPLAERGAQGAQAPTFVLAPTVRVAAGWSAERSVLRIQQRRDERRLLAGARQSAA